MSLCASPGKRMGKYITSQSYGFFLRIFLFLRHSHSQNLFSFFPRKQGKNWNLIFLRYGKLHEVGRCSEKSFPIDLFHFEVMQTFWLFNNFLLIFPKSLFLFLRKICTVTKFENLYVHTLERLNENWKFSLNSSRVSPAEHFRHFLLFYSLREMFVICINPLGNFIPTCLLSISNACSINFHHRKSWRERHHLFRSKQIYCYFALELSINLYLLSSWSAACKLLTHFPTSVRERLNRAWSAELVFRMLSFDSFLTRSFSIFEELLIHKNLRAFIDECS